jgi:hypothetical protein
MMLVLIITGTLLSAPPDAPALGPAADLLAHGAGLRARAQPVPPLVLSTAVVPAPRPRAGLLLVGGAAALAAAADGSAPETVGTVRVAGMSGSELRERLGLDVRVGAPGPLRMTLRWTPFRLPRGGGVRVGLGF